MQRKIRHVRWFLPPSLALAACACSLHHPRPSLRSLTAGLAGRRRCKVQLQAAAVAAARSSGPALPLAACGCTLHTARPSAAGLRCALRLAAAPCTWRARGTVPWLHVEACGCTLQMARPSAAGLGCALHVALAPCSGPAQAFRPHLRLRRAVAPCTWLAQAPVSFGYSCDLQLRLTFVTPKRLLAFQAPTGLLCALRFAVASCIRRARTTPGFLCGLQLAAAPCIWLAQRQPGDVHFLVMSTFISVLPCREGVKVALKALHCIARKWHHTLGRLFLLSLVSFVISRILL